jgi:hypothetical protein
MNEAFKNAVSQHAPTEKQIPFTLKPGEQVTDAFALWAVSDRIAEELGKCSACSRPSFRVVTITSVTKLERRVALCGRHFAITAKAFTHLKSRKSPGVA